MNADKIVYLEDVLSNKTGTKLVKKIKTTNSNKH